MTAEAVKDAYSEFSGFALDAIRVLNQEVKALKAELEERDRECDLLAAALDRLDPDGTKR